MTVLASCQQQATSLLCSCLPIALFAACFHAGFLLGLFFDHKDGRTSVDF
jgi:hypothetical protein